MKSQLKYKIVLIINLLGLISWSQCNLAITDGSSGTVGFSSQGGARSISVSGANCAAQVLIDNGSDSSWLWIQSYEGSIIFGASENTTSSSRSVTVELVATTDSGTILTFNITQNGAACLTGGTISTTLPSAGGTNQYFVGSCSSSVFVTGGTPSWLTVDLGSPTISITSEPNTTTSERTATFTLVSPINGNTSYTKTFNITQSSVNDCTGLVSEDKHVSFFSDSGTKGALINPFCESALSYEDVPSWVTDIQTYFSYPSGHKIFATVQENTASQARSAKIRCFNANTSFYLYVSQTSSVISNSNTSGCDLVFNPHHPVQSPYFDGYFLSKDGGEADIYGDVASGCSFTTSAYQIDPSSIPSWLTVEPLVSWTSGGPRFYYHITYQPNSASTERSAQIIAYKNNDIGNFTLIQRGCIEYNWYLDADSDGFGDINSAPLEFGCEPSNPNLVSNNYDRCPNVYSTTNNGCDATYNSPQHINSITAKTRDIAGNLTTSSVSYFDGLGKPIQSQTVDMNTNKVWASNSLYDSKGRPALQTLSAPINNSGILHYIPDIMLNDSNNIYNTTDFETITDDPSFTNSQANTVGWYYSTQNTDAYHEGNDYQDITERPFFRTIYSVLNPSTALRVIGGNKVDTDNDGLEDNWLQSYTFIMKAGQELTQAIAFNDLSYDTQNDTRKILKTVTRDVHGVENVVFTDTDGKTLAAALVGGGAIHNNNVSIGEQGFVDIHLPEDNNFTGFTINNVSGITTQIHNLITEQLYTGATTSLQNGFYRVSITNLEDYNPTNASSTVSIAYKDNYYDYSLNEYDAIGRLVSSKQPLNHLETTYQYNALGQLSSTTSPDEGTANFVYRKDGQIRFSQNEKQALLNEYSYTNYDFLARPIESGVVSGAFSLTMDGDMDNNFTGTRSEQQATTYDFLEASDSTFLNDVDSSYANPSFLAGNVAKTTNDQTTSYYSYDVYGRVKWIVQDIVGLGVKTIDYEYDAITSQVNQVVYQKHTPSETFVHRYTYDPVDYSLTKVETATVISTDDDDYTEHATYNYYETGALRNVILAEGLQQIDYVYNLAGQLKGINHPNLTAADDPGGNTNDLFGMSIDYYGNDYKRTNAFNNVSQSEDQFNGNIKGITWNTGPNLGQNPVQYAYSYNRNNWLTEANFNGNGNSTGVLTEDITITVAGSPDQTIQAGTSITFSPGFEVTASAGTVFIAQIVEENTGATIEAEDYRVHGITYDANGNIERLTRNKNTENGIVGSNAMDDLAYVYKTDKPNQLLRVDDNALVDSDGNAGVGDIADQDGDVNGENYKYNAIGQLITNLGEDFAYEYNASGLVTTVKKFSTDVPVVKFYYNDKNHRLKKESYNTISEEIIKTTFYIRDASGTPLAIYEKPDNDIAELKEHTIYGASRLGVHYREDGTNAYQLTDHLGNVRAVIVKNGLNAISLTSKTDYYPFGMPMPNRNVEGNYRYGYQGEFAEKEPELGQGVNSFELRLWDSRIGRWLTTDPYGQYSSPYLGMGNNPISFVDPDGGFSGPCDDPPCFQTEALSEVTIEGRSGNRFNSAGLQHLFTSFDRPEFSLQRSAFDAFYGRGAFMSAYLAESRRPTQLGNATPMFSLTPFDALLDVALPGVAQEIGATNTYAGIIFLAVLTKGKSSRRTQSIGDKTFKTERAARREAFRQNNIPTSQANNFTRENVYGNNRNLLGPNGQPSQVIHAQDIYGNQVRIDFHSNGHKFLDNNTFEFPHYHGSLGQHYSFSNMK
jgi:RHS repeat-associated protein